MPGKSVGPIGGKGSYQFDPQAIVASVDKMIDVQKAVEAGYRKAAKLKTLTKDQEAVALAVAKSIILNEPEDKWTESVAAYVKSPKNIPGDISIEVDKIAIEFDLDSWNAIALYRSQTEVAQ